MHWCVYSYVASSCEDCTIYAVISISKEEVEIALSKLKDREAPGEERITYEFYKYKTPVPAHKTLSQAFTDVQGVLKRGNWINLTPSKVVFKMLPDILTNAVDFSLPRSSYSARFL